MPHDLFAPEDPLTVWLAEVRQVLDLLANLPSRLETLSRSMPDIPAEPTAQDLQTLATAWRTAGAATSYRHAARLAKDAAGVLGTQLFHVQQGREGLARATLDALVAASEKVLPDGVITRTPFEAGKGCSWIPSTSMVDGPGTLVCYPDALPTGHPWRSLLPEPDLWRVGNPETGRPALVLSYDRHARAATAGWVMDQTRANRQDQLAALEREQREERARKELERQELEKSDWYVRDRLARLEAELASLRAQAQGLRDDAARELQTA